MVTRCVVEGVDPRGGHKFLTEGNSERFRERAKETKVRFAPQKPPLRYLRFLLLIFLSRRSLGVGGAAVKKLLLKKS